MESFDDYVKNISNNIHHSFLKKVGNIYLNEDEINVLKKYNINYESCVDYNSLLYLISEYLDDECDDLEEVSKNIAERKYYYFTNK